VLQVVWFKKDLRVHDHAPLWHAAKAGPVLALYCHEPHLQAAADCAVQHIIFAQECLDSLREQLHALAVPLWELHSEVISVLQKIKLTEPFALWSHEETGNAASYARDLAIAHWCEANAVVWRELPSNAVVRRLRHRDVWSKNWDQRMASAPLAVPSQITGAQLSSRCERPVVQTTLDKPLRQSGGLAVASAALDSFFGERGVDYRKAMASPLSAQEACSRLSPFFAFGVLSIKQVVHRLIYQRQQVLSDSENPQRQLKAAALRSFEGRLHWHCHFIQKLESQPSIEFENIHPAYNGLRDGNPAHFLAWQKGQTGYPMVDACMKMLAQTGWLNFRMRAMVVSFCSYQLWQHWREPSLHLAREFLDYEPGIHYSQMQMQSGTTGINTIRMYNPIKQAQDQDPTGEFVRHWLPALRQVPDNFIFEPWTMPRLIQEQVQCVIDRDYPAPIVDLAQASKAAREAVWSVRQGTAFKQSAQAIYNKLGSRNPSREGRLRKKKNPADNPAQPSLFD
jgi:deoxyribodipyrimidine photo-lyase